jgi:hypothetical protein
VGEYDTEERDLQERAVNKSFLLCYYLYPIGMVLIVNTRA